mgnify:CR=1 FL=1
MKSEIKITEGKAKIILKAESEFERDLVEKVMDSNENYEIESDFFTDFDFNQHHYHRIEIDLKEKSKNK